MAWRQNPLPQPRSSWLEYGLEQLLPACTRLSIFFLPSDETHGPYEPALWCPEYRDQTRLTLDESRGPLQ